MFDFLKTYWREIIEVVSVLAALVIFLLKKPVTSSLDSDIASDLSVLIPGWIKGVESPGNGDEKKNMVVRLSIKYVKSRYLRSLSDEEELAWTKRINYLIELFLSTPQKKGVQK